MTVLGSEDDQPLELFCVWFDEEERRRCQGTFHSELLKLVENRMTPKPRRGKQYRDVGLAPKVVSADRQFQQTVVTCRRSWTGHMGTLIGPAATHGAGSFPRLTGAW